MKIANCRSSVALFIVCSAALVLLIVNGQPTIDDDVDKDEIAQLRAGLAKAFAQISKMKAQLVAAVEKNDTKQDASKLILRNCFVCDNDRRSVQLCEPCSVCIVGKTYFNILKFILKNCTVYINSVRVTLWLEI